ncbi:MAG: ABC transporter permease [Cyclobacteriaceae bacterium]
MNQDTDNITSKSAERFLSWFLKGELLEEILGDLYEYHEELQDKPVWKRKLFYWFHVFNFLRPFALKKLEGAYQLNNYGMFENYLKMAIRNAHREKAFTMLNIFCLAIGLTACLYAYLYVQGEFQYDKFHEKADRIYRINQTFIWGEADVLFGSTGPAVMAAVKDEIPEFETMCRIHPLENIPLFSTLVEDKKVIFEEDGIRAVDSTFFEVFTFPLVKGNPETALDKPNSVVLTEESAYRYFNSLDVLGKQIQIEDDEVKGTFQVTGVAEDTPNKSHVTFDMLISMSSIKRLNWSHDSWIWTTFVAFGVLRADADPALVADKVADVPAKYLEPFLVKYRGMTYKEFLETGETWDLYMQPLLDIHLSGGKVFSRLSETRDIKSIYIISSIAALILLLSIINFVNLATAKATRRAKEVGVRKVLGSNRGGLIWQFNLESMLFCLLALVLSFGILRLFIEQINTLFGLEIMYWSIFNPVVLLPFIGFTLLTGLLAGIYPAFYLSAFSPVSALKGKSSSNSGGTLVRNSLVTLQFAISIALIATSLFIKNQVGFWLDMDLGFNRNNIIVVQHVDRLGESAKSFKNDLLNLPEIKNASISTDSPPYIWDGDDNFKIEGLEAKSKISFWVADENFADIYGLKFVAGRNFDDSKDHTICTVVSRSLAERFDFSDPNEIIGRQLIYPEFKAKILGVVDDFQTEINWQQLPMAIFFNYNNYYRKNREMSISFRDDLKPEELPQLLVDMEEKWQAVNPGLPMNYYFLDQRFETIFEPSKRLGQMTGFYAILAIIIAGLGLTGLVAYVVERKTKEIGIRKVMGASVSAIMVLLSTEFIKLLVLGFIIASGLSWYLMMQWVQDFEHQAPIPWHIFAIAGLAMLLVSILTIGYQTFKSARANPVDSLKDE